MATRGASTKLILVGAGLSHCLLGWFLKQRKPHLKFQILEANAQLDLKKTWSFHKTDLSAEEYEMMGPLISKEWTGYEVRLPSFNRSFRSGYASIQPEKLQALLLKELKNELQFSSPVKQLSVDEVRLQDGQKLYADVVIDGRGIFHKSQSGFQKFFGMHIKTEKAHGFSNPILMDAKVEQLDGYRFFYLLPWSSNELLIEDTRYSSSADLDQNSFRLEIENYLSANLGIHDFEILKSESGSLPIPLFLNPPKQEETSTPALGVSGGFFHPVTGYSLPDAVRLAHLISNLKDINSHSINKILSNYRQKRKSQVDYFCGLNRMMFLSAEPQQRVQIFEHFYKLSDSTIANFYRGKLSTLDKIKILSGKPPVPIGSALKSFFMKEGGLV